MKIDAITKPTSEMLNQILAALPGIFAASLVLFIAYGIGRFVSNLVTKLLAAAGFNKLPQRLGFGWSSPSVEGEPKAATPAELVGKLALVAVMLFAAIQALSLLGFQRLAELATSFTTFFGDILLGLVIFGLGLYLANLAAETIRASGNRQAGIMATAARVAVIVLAGAMALRQMDVADDIINLAFGLLLGAVAIATAIAFGFGGRELAGRYLERWSGQLDESSTPTDDSASS